MSNCTGIGCDDDEGCDGEDFDVEGVNEGPDVEDLVAGAGGGAGGGVAGKTVVTIPGVAFAAVPCAIGSPPGGGSGGSFEEVAAGKDYGAGDS